MIQSSIELLSEPTKTKCKVWYEIVRKKYSNVKIFETLRSVVREASLITKP